MIDLSKLKRSKASRLASVLGLSLDGSRLEGVVLRRANGAFQALTPFSVSLSLDPLTNDPELVGREIRNHLDALEVRERACVVGLPLKWALVSRIEVPALSEPDAASFIQIEAERSFPCDIQTLHVARSTCRTPSGKQYTLVVGIPRTHLTRFEQVLAAARLKPVSFSLGITALQPPGAESEGGILTLAISESQIGLEVTSRGGVAALRCLEGMVQSEGGQRLLQAAIVARETRITLGQLPPEIGETVRAIRVFGPRDLAQQLVDELDLRLDSVGIKAQVVTRYAAQEFGAPLPAETAVSPAFSLAAHRLANRPVPFEFLPPKVTPWQQMAARYSSGKLRATLTTAGALGVLVGGAFFIQQCRLWRLESQWAAIAATVKNLDETQERIRTYRPWFDESVRGLAILRALTMNFPEDGTVTAKTIEIRDLTTVTCTGTAHSYQALLKTIEKLRAVPQFVEVNLGPTRGQAPALQFSFTLAWNEGGRRAN